MSQSINTCEKTLVAGADLSTTGRYYIVKLDTSGNIVLATAATGAIVGVLQNKPASGEAALYRFGGTTKVICGGTVAIGDWVTTDSAGKAITTTTEGDCCVGRALKAGVTGDLIEIQMNVQHYAS